METSSSDHHNNEEADLKPDFIPPSDHPSVPPSDPKPPSDHPSVLPTDPKPPSDHPSVLPTDSKPPSVPSFTSNDLMDASQGSSVSTSVLMDPSQGSSISTSVPGVMQQQGIIASKPIKKKTPIAIDVDDDAEEEDDHHTAAVSGSGSHSNHGKQQMMMMSAHTHTQQGSSSMNVKELEVQARRDLQQFLSSKHIDPRASDGYSVHIRMQPRKRTIDGYMRSGNSSTHAAAASSGYSVTYSAPDGSILTSKADILNSILEALKRRSQLSQTQGRTSAVAGDHHLLSPLSDTRYGVTTALAAQLTRTDAYELARKTYLLDDTASGAGAAFPRTMDGITVRQPGRVDLRMGFHSLVQIYPVGYLCEQTVSCSSITRGAFRELIECEVGDRDGYPEFRITVKASGDTFIASSEAAVWKKVWKQTHGWT